MLVDGGLSFRSDDPGAEARELEIAGYDGAWSAETGHDPLLIVAGAATATTTLELGTGIVVAFARSPMITATMALSSGSSVMSRTKDWSIFILYTLNRFR